jgi:hypothetical protein
VFHPAFFGTSCSYARVPSAFFHCLFGVIEVGIINASPDVRRSGAKSLVNSQLSTDKKVIVNTVHELDGTTTVSKIPFLTDSGNRQSAIFMVPISTKKTFEPEKGNRALFEQQFLDLFKAIFGTPAQSTD